MGKRVIAVIDDDRDIAAFLAELLTEEGYEPALWHRGAGAYAFVKRTMPSAILLDMNMETPDAGLLVAEAVCGDTETQAIPIIIVSAGTDAKRAYSRRLQDLRCKVHGKPVDIPALLSLISDVIAEAGVAS